MLRTSWSLEGRPGLQAGRGRPEAEMIVVVVTLVSTSVFGRMEAMGVT